MDITIPGGTAQLRDRLNVRGKRQLLSQSVETFAILRKKFDGDLDSLKTAKPDEIRHDGELMDAIDDFGLTSMVAFMVGWDLPQTMPTSREEWLDFEDTDVYDALVKEVTTLGYAALGNNTIVVTPETVQDRESPTGPSSD